MKNLSKNESKVYKHLTQEYKSVAAITKASRMPRMTVYTVLLRLEKYKLARKLMFEGRKTYVWARTSEASRDESSRGVNMYKGIDNIKKIIMDLTLEIPGRRMYTYQSSKNFDLWIERFGKDWVNAHNKAVVDMSLLVFSLYTDNVSKDIIEDSDIIKSYKGRRGGSHAVPHEYLRYGLATYVFDNIVLTVDIVHEVAHLTKSELLAESVISIFRFAYDNTEQDRLFRLHGR